MQRAMVDERRRISQQRFPHALNFCMLLPGPEAHQLAIYVGWLLNGRRGGMVAGVLFVLPHGVALPVLSALYVSRLGRHRGEVRPFTGPAAQAAAAAPRARCRGAR